jgi:excisionase family DNA binding protein
MNERNSGLEIYMTIKDVAEYLQLSKQTIQRYVLKREIPYLKIRKVIRFRLSELEQWIDNGGGACRDVAADDKEGDLFAGLEPEESTTGETETGADGQAAEPRCPPVAEGKAGETEEVEA